MNTIILITNQDEIKTKLQENLVLLRSSDKLLAANYDNAPDVLYDLRPDIIILHEHENREKRTGLIKYLKERRIFSNSNIILLVNNYDRAFILYAYDQGIDDYITVNSEPSEILIRVINSIRKSELNSKIRRYASSLSYYGILDKDSGFYNTKFEDEVLEKEIHREDYIGGTYMLISPDENGKKEFSCEKFEYALQKSVRTGDIVSNSTGSKYSLLLHTGVDGAIKVLEKIKSELPEKCTIKCGISMIDGKDFKEIKKKAICALNSAMLNNSDYIVFSTEETNSEDWLEIPEKEEKTFKFLKKAFTKKIENTIAPVFYRVQKAYEEKIGEAKIAQFTDESQSVFRIICGKNESRFTMIYPAYSKVIVYITHSGFDSPENREFNLPLSDITQDRINDLLEGFVNEFIGIYRHIH